MTSERKIKANRANSRASSGPKTSLGRVRAAQNALRHGLSLSIHSDRALSKEVEALAREIARIQNLHHVVRCASPPIEVFASGTLPDVRIIILDGRIWQNEAKKINVSKAHRKTPGHPQDLKRRQTATMPPVSSSIL